MDLRLENLRRALLEAFDADRIKENEPLSRHCNWRAGGPADLFLTAKTVDELRTAVLCARVSQQPVTVLGFGANVLVSDRGIRGLVILNRAHGIKYLARCRMEVDSGTNLAVLAKQAGLHGISGLEFLIGIPGTLGAAVAVNAGTRTEWISTIVLEAWVVGTKGDSKWVKPDELNFSYRHSRLKETGGIVLKAVLQGKSGAPEAVEANLARELQVRKTQPTGPSAGSVFTNPEGDFAGRLIEAAGLKGYGVGGAQVSEMHANFIVNSGGTSAADIRSIIEHVKSEVCRKFHIELREEIRYLGEW